MVKLYIDGIDVSDFVVQCSDISVCATNRNYKLYAPSLSFKLVDLNDTKFVKEGKRVSVEIDSFVRYVGFIESMSFNYSKNEWSVKVRNILYRLKYKKVCYNNLNAKILQGRDYVPSNQAFNPLDWDFSSAAKWVNAPYLLKCMIEDGLGILCDTSRLNDVNTGEVVYSSLFNKLIPIPMLWCVGQDVATSHTILEANAEYRGKYVSYFELIDLIFGLLKIKITLEGGKFWLSHISENDEVFSVSGNDVYRYSKRVKLNSYRNVNVLYSTANATLGAYEGDSVYELNEWEAGYSSSATKDIRVFNNFMFTTTYIGLDLEVWKQSWFGIGMLEKYVCSDYLIGKYTTGKNMSTAVLLNSFDVKKEESKLEVKRHLWFEADFCSIEPGADDVDVDVSIFFGFTMMVTELEAKLYRGSNEVDCILILDNSGLSFSFTPMSNLEYNTNYTFVVKDVKNVYGRKIKSAFYRGFTTKEDGGIHASG